MIWRGWERKREGKREESEGGNGRWNKECRIEANNSGRKVTRLKISIDERLNILLS